MKENELLKFVIQYAIDSLNETHKMKDDFNIGQTYAYVSVLEAIQSKGSKEQLKALNLDWRMEDIYTIK